MRCCLLLALTALCLASPALADWELCMSPQEQTCIWDADSVRLKGERIRLMGYDAPEKGSLAKCAHERQLSDKATARLRDILNSGYVTFERRGKDKYRRTLAIVRVGGENVGKTLIREGLAYAYKGGKRDRFRWCR